MRKWVSDERIINFDVDSETTCRGHEDNIQDKRVDYGLDENGFADCSEGIDGWVKLSLSIRQYITYLKILTPPDGR